MKRWALLAIGLGSYAIALIATAPATLLDAGLRRFSEGQLRLAGAQGTLWLGAGQFEIRDAGGRTGLSKRLAWRLRPQAALLAQLRYEVEFDAGSRPFPVTILWSGVELKDADIRLPAGALGLGVAKIAALELTGEVNLRVSSLFIGRSAARGSAALQWLRAGSLLSPVPALGDYELHLEGKGPAVSAILRTLQGPLQLDGQGSWAIGDRPVFLATAQIPDELKPKLEPFLRMIAVERSEGRFELRLN